MEAGEECANESRTAVVEISEKLDATANELGNEIATEDNGFASFESLQSGGFNTNIDSQSPEATPLNGDEVRKEAGKVVEALIMSFEEDKLEHELSSSSHRLEQLMPANHAEMVIGGDEEGEGLLVEKDTDVWCENLGDTVNDKATEEEGTQELLQNKYTCQNVYFCEDECQSNVCKIEESLQSGDHNKKASLSMEKPVKGPNSVDMDFHSEEHSTNPVHHDISKGGLTLSASDKEKGSLSSLDQDIIHGYDCNEESLPDPALDIKGDILEALPHLHSKDEMKALVDTVANMDEKAEAGTDTLIIKGWGEIDDTKCKKDNFEALTEEVLYEAGFVTISPLSCGFQPEGSTISADSSGNISEAERGFLMSAVLAGAPEKIEVDLSLRNTVNELGSCSGGGNEWEQSKFSRGPVKGESQLGEAWRPTAEEEAAAALADSNAHPAQHLAEEHVLNWVDVKCKMDAEGGGMVDNRIKGGELKEWLLVKEREFDEILGHEEDNEHACKNAVIEKEMDGSIPEDGHVEACEIEVMACEMSQANTQTEGSPGTKDISAEGSPASTYITESTTDLMDELELQSEILRQITEKATVVSADNNMGERIKRSEEHDGKIKSKKGKKSTPGSKSMKAKKKIPKSPLLKRSEIQACIDLHNACENADILQELIHPAICFGSSHEAARALEQDVVCSDKELERKTISNEEVDEPVFVEEVTWQDPPQPRPRKPVFAGKPRWQPIRVASLAPNQFSHFSGCHVNVSQDISCVTAFIHAAITGVLVDYLNNSIEGICMISFSGCGCSLFYSWNGLVPLENPLPPPPHWHCRYHQPGYGEEWRQLQGVKHWPVFVRPGPI